MKNLLFAALLLFPMLAQAEMLYPGKTVDIEHRATSGDHSPSWSTTNPTLHLSSTGFLCHVKAQAYFSGTATVTCSYDTYIGSSKYEYKKSWTFTCADARMSISPTSKSVKTGESFQITWSFSTATYKTPSMQFTGYDENIVSVSNSGYVTAKAAGTTDIYVKSDLGTNSVICKVKVSDAATGGTTGAAGGYYDWDSTGARRIVLKEPGTLGDSIPESEKYKITNLSIAGPMNGADLRLLRDMAGTDCKNESTKGKLETLDLKDAVFVSGGPWYLNGWDNAYEYTNDEPVMPKYSFRWCKAIKRLRFPKYCTVVSNRGTLHCNNLELLAIPPGTTRIDYECLTGGWNPFAMTTLTMPSSLKEFGARIYNCGNLTDMYCYASEPPRVEHPKDFISQSNISKGTLYVPKGSADAYWRAEGWRGFKNIKETLDVFNTLYIHVGEHGSVKFHDEKVEMTYPVSYAGHQAFEVQEDEEVEVEVAAHEGYVLARVLLDEQELPLPNDSHTIKIGKLSGISTLKVEFKEIASVEMIEFEDDEPVDVYNANGVLLRQNVEKGTVHDLPAGLYIIRGKKGASKMIVH